MRLLLAALAALAALAVAAAPAPKGPARPKRGLLRHACAPWDGPALQLMLSAGKPSCGKELYPSNAFSIWKGLPPKPGVPLILENGDGNGNSCPKKNGCRLATKARVTFDVYQETGTVRGTYELEFPEGKETGAFEATWCESHALCG